MAAEAEAEEEVRLELEAVAAVYGDDCRVLRDLPPHLVVHVRPRTADDSSQQVAVKSGVAGDSKRNPSSQRSPGDQWAVKDYALRLLVKPFVELFLGIEASPQYPKEPPHIYAAESKGLDESRQAYLISTILNKAKELSSYPMLVTLCEEAGEILSNMNHPAGDCPLCLYPLVGEDKDGSALPFMKLMSCYHCFHSDCIMRWWEWLQHGDVKPEDRNIAVMTQDKHCSVNRHKGFCPVCRKVFDEKDIEHVHNLLGSNTSHMASLTIVDLEEDEKELLQSEAEQNRRKKIESLVNLQQECNGLIEPKKDLAIQPGMYVALPPSVPATAAGDNDPCEDTTTSTSEVEPHSLTNNTISNKNKNSGHRRRSRANALRRQPHAQPGRQQWQRKEADTSHQ